MSASVFSAGGGHSSVEAWYSAAHDMRSFCQVSVRLTFMFSLMMSSSHLCDTVDRKVLDLFLGRTGFFVCFPEACFGCHANVRLRCKLSCGLGEPWTLDGSIARDALFVWSLLM